MKVLMMMDFKPDSNFPQVQEHGPYDFFCMIVREHLNKGNVRFGLKSLTGQYFVECDNIPVKNFVSFVNHIEAYGGVCH